MPLLVLWTIAQCAKCFPLGSQAWVPATRQEVYSFSKYHSPFSCLVKVKTEYGQAHSLMKCANKHNPILPETREKIQRQECYFLLISQLYEKPLWAGSLALRQQHVFHLQLASTRSLCLPKNFMKCDHCLLWHLSLLPLCSSHKAFTKPDQERPFAGWKPASHGKSW